MGAEVRITVESAHQLTLALSAVYTSKIVKLIGLYGTDGVNTGSDSSGDPLVFPVMCSEGSAGVYSTLVILESVGVYFAKFTMDDDHVATLIIRVVSSGYPTADTRVDTGTTIAAVTTDGASSVRLTITDSEGNISGQDSNGDDLTMPLTMVQVTGHTDSWYYESVYFGEGGTYALALQGEAGPVWNDTIVVWEAAQASATHFDGWEPDAAYSPSDWLSVGYIRRWTGWEQATVGNSTVKELRRLAIETFITETNRWFPLWSGTWYGLRPQGSRLYMPVPVMTKQDGASSDPTFKYHERYGSQTEIETIDSDNLIYSQRGRFAKQPFIELGVGYCWRGEYGVKVTGSFGEVDAGRQRLPEKVKQVIVGLIRWHSLSYAVGPDEARDQATVFRTRSESSRDHSVNYDDKAIGAGITGDPTIDREIARLTIHPAPEAYRYGSA